MAIHFSNLAWEIPWTEKSGGLQSMGVVRQQLTTTSSQYAINIKIFNDIFYILFFI